MVKDFSEPAFLCTDYSFRESSRNNALVNLYFPIEDASKAIDMEYKSEPIYYADDTLASRKDSVVSAETIAFSSMCFRAECLKYFHFELSKPFIEFLNQNTTRPAKVRTEARKLLGLCVFNKDCFYEFLEVHCPNIYEQFKRYEALNELYNTLIYNKEQEELLLQLSTAH
mgnify:CR=1 FL=1